MKKKKLIHAILWSAMLVGVAGCKTNPAEKQAEAVTTEKAASAAGSSTSELDTATVQSIAEEAYIYGFPLVMNYLVFHDSFLDPTAKGYKGPMNQLHNDARVYTSADTTVQTPNSDTPYGILGADLRAEPIVICVPEIEKGRYYSVQMVDMYTHNYGYLGTRATGNDGGCYLVVGPSWKGEMPPGIEKVFRCESPFSMIIFRTQLFDATDIENVKTVQAGYNVQTLSSFLKQPAPAAAPEIEWPKAPKTIFATGFTGMLDYLLGFLPPTGPAEGEKILRARFASIGIGPDKTISVQDLSADQKAALGNGAKLALGKIGHALDNLGEEVNGWRIGAAAGSREFYDGNYLLRAVASKAGIYGNDFSEATYPFAKLDVNGHPLDGSMHDYVMTFAPGQLPPVNAFWSITMYDAETQLLVDNPINRYLINQPMLSDLKKNADGSISVYIQRNSPGADLESNWLPAPNGPIFMVMRLYWPKTEEPSVLPPGKGTWQPPAIVPVANKKAEKVNRPGNKSYENVVRTDERYGHDPLFQGPRGWSYWNFLEYAKPIQNPNLWPDTQSTYFLSRFAMPAGSTLTFAGSFPQARYFKYALYVSERNTFVSTGESLTAKDIVPDKGSTNPYEVGGNRLADHRDYTLSIVAEDAPADVTQRKPNTMYAGTSGAELQLVIRVYLPDQGMDGAGWGPADTPFTGRGLPSYEGTLADGTKLNLAEVAKQFGRPMESNTKAPMTAAQWVGMVNDKANDPSLDPATSPARENPVWEKFWTLKYSVLGAYKTQEDRAKIPYAGAMEGGGDPATQYMISFLSRKFGPVYVMRGRMPTFPDTFAGAGGRGLEIMPDAESQYWSLVSCEAAPSGQIVDGLTDMQVPLDANRNYTIVVSRKEDRPKNATLENGIAWMEWSSRGEGLNDPRNREDFGMLMLRIMANNPEWKQSPDHVLKPGTEQAVMGPYLPRGEYTDKATFEANGTK